MKEIQLGGHKRGSKITGYVIIDDEDFEKVSKYNWCLAKRGIHNYAKSYSPGKKLTYLHRFIFNPPNGKLIDHINRNGLDNRKENLRLCTHAENRCNRGKTIENSTGYKGVYRSYTKIERWVARISCGNIKSKDLGSFKTKREAAIAYNLAAKKYHGEFAYQNKII
jgi:hypothetical protein